MRAGSGLVGRSTLRVAALVAGAGAWGGVPVTAAPPAPMLETRVLVGPGQADQGIMVDVADTGSAIVGRRAGTNFHNGYAMLVPVGVSDGALVDAAGPTPTRLYGIDVAVSDDGSRYVVGAPDDSTFGAFVGALYVYGAQNEVLGLSDLVIVNGVGIGTSVDMSGDGSVIVAGAPSAGGGALAYSGMAYVFAETAPGSWSNVRLVPSSVTTDAFFGTDVAVSDDGNTIAVSAMGEGAVYVFERSGASWVETLRLGGFARNIRFGHSIALSGNGDRLAVGAPLDQEPGDQDCVASGAVFLFDLSSAPVPAPMRLTSVAPGYTPHPVEEYGISVAFDDAGLRLLVGAPGATVNADTGGPGAVYLVTSNAGVWTQEQHFPSNATWTRAFGTSVSMSGDSSVMVIGADSTSTSGYDPLYVWRRPPPPPPSNCPNATIVGTPGDDVLHGTKGADVIDGGDGDDIIDGRGGNDIVCGGAGHDQISGGGTADVIFGDDGDDVVNGNGGDDIIHGGAGDDTITGGAGSDRVFGDRGNDTMFGNGSADELDGGADINSVDGGASNADRCWNAATLIRCELGPPDS